MRVCFLYINKFKLCFHFTYSIQYFLETIEHYDDYKSRFAPALQAEYNKRYQNRFVAFRTLLETV